MVIGQICHIFPAVTNTVKMKAAIEPRPSCPLPSHEATTCHVSRCNHRAV